MTKSINRVQQLILVAVVALAVVGIWAVARSEEQSIKGPASDHQSNDDQPPDQDQDPTATIAGDASYPSERVPSDFEVCARPTNGDLAADICTETNDQGVFEIEVEAGTYTVFALSDTNRYVAYYDECMTLADPGDCAASDQGRLVEIAASAGSKVEDINPSAWYGPADYDEFTRSSN
jgi:hypothetical protein